MKIINDIIMFRKTRAFLNKLNKEKERR